MSASQNDENVCSACNNSGYLQQGGSYRRCACGVFPEDHNEPQPQADTEKLDDGGNENHSHSVGADSGTSVHPNENTSKPSPRPRRASTQGNAASDTSEESEGYGSPFCKHGHRFGTDGCHFDSADECSDADSWDEYRGYDSDA